MTSVLGVIDVQLLAADDMIFTGKNLAQESPGGWFLFPLGNEWLVV